MAELPTSDAIAERITSIRGHKVLLDEDFARLYGVETRALVQAVKRNAERFPEDFMFQVTREEFAALRSQLVILKGGRGQHRTYLPYAFTEASSRSTRRRRRPSSSLGAAKAFSNNACG